MYNTLFYFSFYLLSCVSSLSQHFISIQKYKWPLDRTFHFHSVDFHCAVRKIQTLLFLRCIFMMSWKTFLKLASSFFSFSNFSGVCATLTVLKPTSILFVLPMGNLMIMHVKSKRHHARNRRKLKSCLWVDVKVTLITKPISKNVSNFCLRIKKRTGAGSYLALLTFPLDSCHLYCGVQAVGGGRALRGTDAKREVRSGVHNPSHTLPTVAGNCPPLLWFQNQAPVFCPEQLVQSCVLQVGVGAGSRKAPQVHFAIQGGSSVAPFIGAAQSSLRKPKTCLGQCLFLMRPVLGPWDARGVWKEILQ